jgi:acetolactate synthase small subunit
MLRLLTFVIAAENDPDLLARTVLLFHRLAIPIHGLTMQRPGNAPHMRLTVTVLSDPDRSDRIAANLTKIAPVFSVEVRQPGIRQERLANRGFDGNS